MILKIYVWRLKREVIELSHDNEGTARLVKSIRNQAGKVFNTGNRVNVLGTIHSNGIYIDAIEDIIPRSDFLFLQTELYSTDKDHTACNPVAFSDGDRILCVPVGDYYIVIGKVV